MKFLLKTSSMRPTKWSSGTILWGGRPKYVGSSANISTCLIGISSLRQRSGMISRTKWTSIGPLTNCPSWKMETRSSPKLTRFASTWFTRPIERTCWALHWSRKLSWTLWYSKTSLPATLAQPTFIIRTSPRKSKQKPAKKCGLAAWPRSSTKWKKKQKTSFIWTKSQSPISTFMKRFYFWKWSHLKDLAFIQSWLKSTAVFPRFQK